MSALGDKACWAKCTRCGHIWPAAYYPIELTKLGKILGKTHCPKCAARPGMITMAKQNNGILEEKVVPFQRKRT